MHCDLPLSLEVKRQLTAGQKILLSGMIYTARDAAHKKIVESLQNKQSLPFELKDAVIFYAGPTPARENGLPGAIGPTTSSRMDPYTVPLLEAGISAVIGKGERAPEIMESMAKHDVVYFIAVGGIGALLAKCIRSMTCVAWPELGPEAVYRMEVKDFPVVVGMS